jgi:hypothetical protein
MPKQARADGMSRLMGRDPLFLLFSAAARGEEFVVFIDPRNHGIGRGALP